MKSKWFVLLVGGLFVFSCGVPRDTKFRRFMQTLTAQYNILYNAQETERYMLVDLEARHRENFTEPIPVLIKYSKENILQEQKALFRIQKKANKIIEQKELSNRVGDAYLYLAKANYYADKKIEAEKYVDYIRNTYGNSKRKNLMAETLLWKAKILIDYEDKTNAYRYVDSILQVQSSEGKNRYTDELMALKAQLMFQLNSKNREEAFQLLSEAYRRTSGASNKQRWALLLSQWADSLGYKSDLLRYNQIAASRNKYTDIKLYAKIRGIAYNERLTIPEKIAKISKFNLDSKYVGFKDIVYESLAFLEFDRNNESQGINQLIKAAILSTDALNKHRLFLKIADKFYFDERNYTEAKTYYDSCLVYLPKDHIHYDALKRKSDKLVDIALYDNIIRTQDTLLLLAKMKADKRASYLDSIHRRNEKERIKNRVEVLEAIEQSASASGETDKKIKRNTFYFYNPERKNEGRYRFIELWGEIDNKNNWRTLSQKKSSIKSESETGKEAVSYWAKDVVAMLNKVPKTEEEKEEARMKIADALYKKGQSFMLVIKDYKNAIETLEELLSEYPKYGSREEIYYNLFDLNKKIEDYDRAEYYRKLILEQYPNSIYAKTLENTDYLKDKENELKQMEVLYTDAYKAYQKHDFSETIQICKNWISKYGIRTPNSSAVYYLKAMAIGYTQPVSSFEAALREIVSLFSSDNELTARIEHLLQQLKNKQMELSQRPVALELEGGEPAFDNYALTQYKKELWMKTPKTKYEKTLESIEKKGLSVTSTDTFSYLIVINVKVGLNSIKRAMKLFNSQFFDFMNLRIFSGRIGNSAYVGTRTFKTFEEALAYKEKMKSRAQKITELKKDQYYHGIVVARHLPTFERQEDLKVYMNYLIQLEKKK